MSRSVVYVAGALFSIGEQSYNATLANLLSKNMDDVEFVLPQHLTKLYWGQKDFYEKIFRECLASIDRAHALLTILEGPDVDSGTAVEMGYAFAKKKPVIGVRTDFRPLTEGVVNLMVAGVCKQFLWLPSCQVELDQAVDKIASALRLVLYRGPSET